MVVPGYWADPEATKKGFVAGYWLSGDIGSIDAQGFVRVFDRAKDMLNRGGFKIYSVEVENVLLEHPAVVESGDRRQAVTRCSASACTRSSALKPGADASADGAAALLRRAPRRLQGAGELTLTTTPLPRNANGKLLKRELRQQIIDQETT